jgi:hypothetical protein
MPENLDHSKPGSGWLVKENRCSLSMIDNTP